VPDRPTWLAEGSAGLELSVHVRPGAARSAVVGLHGDALCVRVAARPVDGAANRELLRVLAEALGVPRSALALRRGARGRDKRVQVAGVPARDVVARIAPLLR
jgi:uncharacterized protein (TIGR00251 family)